MQLYMKIKLQCFTSQDGSNLEDLLCIKLLSISNGSIISVVGKTTVGIKETILPIKHRNLTILLNHTVGENGCLK